MKHFQFFNIGKKNGFQLIQIDHEIQRFCFFIS